LNRPLEGQQALARFHPDAEDGSLPPEEFVVGIEKAILLQPASAKRRNAGSGNCRTCNLCVVEAELDLALHHDRHAAYLITSPAS
jgi:hypothetical protein